MMLRRSLLAAGGVLAGATLVSPRPRAEEPVDVLLVLAVDVSRSVDEDEAKLQREGYRTAMTDPRIVEAVQGGMIGAIAVTYMEWAGAEYQRQVLPWMRLTGGRDAERWASALAEAPRASLSWTSISGALAFGTQLLDQAPFEAERRVIDVSGDGVNNSGPPAEQARDAAVAKGIVINGLPIMNDRPSFSRRHSLPLDQYYADAVIGGPGAFLVAADDFDSFGAAIRRKLIREIAGRSGPRMERA